MAVGLRGGGFLGGALLGGVVSLGAGGVASVMVPLEPKAPVVAPQVSDEAPGDVEAPTVSQTPAPLAEVSDTAPQTVQSTTQAAAPEQDSLDGLETATVAIATAPETGEVAGLVTPAEVPQTGAVPLTEEDPVFPNPQALAPMLPQDADVVAIDTAPAEPPKPPVVVSDAVKEIIEELQPAKIKEVAPQPESGSASTEEAIVAQVAPQTDQPEEAVQSEEVGQTEQAEQSEQVGQTEQNGEAEQTEQVELKPVAPPVNLNPATPETAEAEEERHSNGVIVNRLGNGAAEPEAEQVTVITQDGATTTGGDPRPIKRFGQPFANAENKPLMSIVLIDDGSNPTSGAPGIAALRSFPYTLSFAVDSGLPDAAERMALYRSEGFEVLAMVDLPQGAQATDVETTLGVTLSQMREVVGLLDGEGLQSSREVSDQVTAILAQSGHGLVTMDKGLNTMPKLARKEGVPADPVFP
ncbi:hypothetical protein GQR58_028969 [Nymphon striatum]|nr:hypothetical protein GQR58_028969 [Nymphon striatum]